MKVGIERLIPVVIGVILLGVLIYHVSRQQMTKVYGETTTVAGKTYGYVERYYFYPVESPRGYIWRSSHRGLFRVCKIATSNGTEYEILFKDYWDLIKENDVVKKFSGIPFNVERGNGLYWESTYAPIPGTLCWLELWRNGTYLKDIKVYRPPR